MAQHREDLKVTQVRRLESDGAVKALCDVSVDGRLLIRGMRVVDGKKGLFVSMPRVQGRDSKWYDTVTALTDEIRHDLTRIVLEAYQATAETAAT
ncbi:MAG TPA: septation protein SpoVG family protein [bacterium]